MYGKEATNFNGELWSGRELGGALQNDWKHLAIRAQINFIEVVDEPGLSAVAGRIHSGLNSGYQAIGLAAQWDPAKIVLLGYDMQRGPNGESHHHGDHEGGLPNLGTMDEWARRMVQLGADLRGRGVEVINASTETAITCFERRPIARALKGKPAIVLQGMHGLGDNLHQRAIVRRLVMTHTVWLETPWPSVYHDLPVRLLSKPTALRTQEKNSKRERAKYVEQRAPETADQIRIWYTHEDIRAKGSFLAAMASNCGVDVRSGDFALPIPKVWQAKAQRWIDRWRPSKPLMIYRPLVERTEWQGCAQRNPDHAAYAALARSIRERFFVVSVADLEPGTEWMVGDNIRADVECHTGELEFETLAALFARSGIVFCSPGFAIVLAQAVGAPLVTVFGGHEAARFYDHGDPRHHFIEPIRPCECFSKTHFCDKRIDLLRAEQALREFTDDTCAAGHQSANGRAGWKVARSTAVPA